MTVHLANVIAEWNQQVDGRVELLTEEAINIVLDVKLKGTILTCQAAIPQISIMFG